jgi:hypothetical protein
MQAQQNFTDRVLDFPAILYAKDGRKTVLEPILHYAGLSLPMQITLFVYAYNQIGVTPTKKQIIEEFCLKELEFLAVIKTALVTEKVLDKKTKVYTATI